MLLDHFDLHGLDLQNRLVMPPMTRNRASDGAVPSALAATYYRQRNAAGLAITEGTQPAPHAQGYPRTPGIYSQEQVEGWRRITDAIHAGGAKAFAQIMHAGRVAHTLNTGGARGVAPSAIAVSDGSKVYTDQRGEVPFETPEALSPAGVIAAKQEHSIATENAFAAGFDGVELHATSGYLVAQFLASNSNQRTDQYGGSVANRIRFAIETLEQMIDAARAAKPELGAAASRRVGIRISPGLVFNDIHDADPVETHTALLQAIAPLNLGYVHIQRMPDFFGDFDGPDVVELFRDKVGTVLIATGNYAPAEAEATLKAGTADLIGFGRGFLANPDFVKRLTRGGDLNTPDPNTFYTPGPEGYTDYPAAS